MNKKGLWGMLWFLLVAFIIWYAFFMTWDMVVKIEYFKEICRASAVCSHLGEKLVGIIR